jgi:CheY-like chemotaxis protein
MTETAPEESATILIAEDDEGQRRLLEMLLYDYQLTLVKDGREALNYLQGHTPSLMILDVAMPYLSGIDICDRARRIKRLKGVPVVILTSLNDDRTHTAARMAGASAVITKPLTGKDFRLTVRKLLQPEQSVHSS